jgi:hypothetical protein
VTSAGEYTQEDHAKYRERVEEERKAKEAAAKEQQRHAFLAAGGRPEDFEAEYKAQERKRPADHQDTRTGCGAPTYLR